MSPLGKISVYVTPELHRRLKIAAAERGVSLSEFMLQAAEVAAQAPGRYQVASRMDALRSTVRERFTQEELREFRDEGRP